MTEPTAIRPAASVWQMYRALVGVGMLCGLLIVLVYTRTLPVIENNRTRALERAVFRVLPGAVTRRSLARDALGHLRPATREDPRQQTVHAGYDAQGALVGIAVPGAAMGYQDTIQVLYGYDPETETVIGLQVLASRETPGLGDKIGKDPAFLANFDALDVRLDAAGQAPANPVTAVRHGEKSAPWQVDGITGATISSQAVARLLRESNRLWLPVIRRQFDTLGREAGDDG